jgi:antiviral defense system Shedu protein SduA
VNSHLVTDFILHDGQRVATICTVTVIAKDGKYTPRLKFWKKDKTKDGNQPVLTELPDDEATRTVKALVDTSDGHRNLWLLIDFLRQFPGLTLPTGTFTIVGKDSAEIAELLKSSDKAQVVEAMKLVLGNSLTQAELDIIANRKEQLDIFDKLLHDEDYFRSQRDALKAAGKDSKPEAVWQAFFEKNPWIFGYGLNLIACQSYDDHKLEQITTGASKFTGAGKRTDGLLRTRGVVSSLVFCEIKRPDLPLLAPTQYRPPDVWMPSQVVTGAVSQVQKTSEKAVREIRDVIHKQSEPDGTPTGIAVATIRPRQVVVVGDTTEFVQEGGELNHEKVSAFELYRRSINDVEIITFDELYARARFIIHDA